ncbi:hypothetical protein AVEN_83303-1 [Araneus ventricosus]|uniref:Uncharacterized protein n=1 Tax=Araneus ventricosus TaxID=182803 RepID=A0A4Y2TF73_ARAVE|nr:hypothetical protein AVEN_197861-1 [Araneus ventricosus]GBN99262.1 hypothetical protein AVEN_17176-1 [Araneus ventricosus]GBN99265.1 hypothetical protein AVEN_63625-1 [Araneus ventricosus]GBN99267.1 hypothetical protein AVEN_83303-1 [Araneus ventricosus]
MAVVSAINFKASKLFTTEEFIEDKFPALDYHIVFSDEEDVIPPFFKDAMDSIEKLRTHSFCQKNSEKAFNELNLILNDVINTHRQSARQKTVTDFLN